MNNQVEFHEPIEGWVQSNWLENSTVSSGVWKRCQAIGLVAYPGELLTLKIVCEGVAIFDYLPFFAFVGTSREGIQNTAAPAYFYRHLFYDNAALSGSACPDFSITLQRFAALGDCQAILINAGDHRRCAGRILYTIDFPLANDSANIVLLENGQLAAIPNYRCLVGATSLTPIPKILKWSGGFVDGDAEAWATRQHEEGGAAGLVLMRDGLVLAVSRGEDLRNWGLPCGKIDPGETPLEAMKREVWEEAGITDIVRPRVLFRRHVHVDKHDNSAWVGHGPVVTQFSAVDAKVPSEFPTTREGTAAWKKPEDLCTQWCSFAGYNRALFLRLGVRANAVDDNDDDYDPWIAEPPTEEEAAAVAAVKPR